jgi:hypothetical protein
LFKSAWDADLGKPIRRQAALKTGRGWLETNSRHQLERSVFRNR